MALNPEETDQRPIRRFCVRSFYFGTSAGYLPVGMGEEKPGGGACAQ